MGAAAAVAAVRGGSESLLLLVLLLLHSLFLAKLLEIERRDRAREKRG